MNILDLFSKNIEDYEEIKYPCQCCGFNTIYEVGCHEVCPVCFWEDDRLQNDDPFYAGGANRICLNEARENYKKIGASEERFLKHVREPYVEEIPDDADDSDDEGDTDDMILEENNDEQ